MALNPKQLQAITHLAIGETDAEVARIIEVHVNTISKWKKNAEFIEALRSAVDTAMERFEKAIGDVVDDVVTAHSIGDKKKRVEVLGEVRDKILQLIKERGELYAEKYPDIPGGSTGLIGMKVSALCVNHIFDSAIVAKLLDVQKAASDELGQSKEKPKTPTKLYDKLPIDEL